MLRLPPRFAEMILAFAPVFVQPRTWRHARLLLLGAMLAPGQRTVSSILRIVGLRRERHFVNYHRVLNRAVWNSRHGARLLLGLLISRFVSTDPIVLGVDDTIERRRGKRIGAKGLYRDPVRSSKSFFVKTSGLRWLSLMLLAPIPWAQQVWGLPFLTVLAPSERFCRTHNRRHKKLTDWTRQVALHLGSKLAWRNRHAALAAEANDCSRRRQQFCRARSAGRADTPGPDLHHPPAPGCCPV